MLPVPGLVAREGLAGVGVLGGENAGFMAGPLPLVRAVQSGFLPRPGRLAVPEVAGVSTQAALTRQGSAGIQQAFGTALAVPPWEVAVPLLRPPA